MHELLTDDPLVKGFEPSDLAIAVRSHPLLLGLWPKGGKRPRVKRSNRKLSALTSVALSLGETPSQRPPVRWSNESARFQLGPLW